jgi:hypothetical protein
MAPEGPNPGPEVEDRKSETGGESYLAWTKKPV